MNQNSNNKIKTTEKNEIDDNNIIEKCYSDEKNDEKIEELTKDLKLNFASEYKKKNKESIANISVESKEKINSRSALSYIFSNIPNNNYKKEIEYLYENIVLPEREQVHVNNFIFLKKTSLYRKRLINIKQLLN